MAKVIWSPTALEDFKAVLAYIAADSPVASKRFGQKLLARTRQIRIAPLMGGYVREDETKTYREVLFGNYRVIYRTDEDGKVAYIVTIYPASRLLDPKTLK
jgi:toxin ParE1/3/4